MEDELDKIEEAHLDWRKVLKEFYEPFTSDMAAAGKNMISTKMTGEPTDVKCPECKEPMEKRLNRYGYYLRCTKAPDCKGTHRLDRKGNIQEREKPRPTGIKCDLCGAEVVRATGRFGPYLACERYLNKECTFTMKLNKDEHPVRKFKPFPTEIECEKCKAPMVVRVTFRGKNRRPFLSCSKFPKCRNALDLPEELKEVVGKQAMAQYHENVAKDQRDLVIFQKTLAQQEELQEKEQAVASAANGGE